MGAQEAGGRAATITTIASTSTWMVEPLDCGTDIAAGIEGPHEGDLACDFFRMRFFDGPVALFQTIF